MKAIPGLSIHGVFLDGLNFVHTFLHDGLFEDLLPQNSPVNQSIGLTYCACTLTVTSRDKSLICCEGEGVVPDTQDSNFAAGTFVEKQDNTSVPGSRMLQISLASQVTQQTSTAIRSSH